MRLTLHTVICCCIFTTVLPLAKGSTGEINTSLKKRFRVWLQSRMKRDLFNSSDTANERCFYIYVTPQQEGEANSVSPPSSFGLKIRLKRSSSSKSPGCVLVTCSTQDLIFRLHQIYNSDNSQKVTFAPKKKIGLDGYGRRRRRSLLDVTQLALQTGRQRRSTDAGQRVHRHKSTHTVA